MSLIGTATSSCTASNSSLYWSDLPTELELQIINYSLVVEGPITRETHAETSKLLLKLALQNKHLSVLAEQIYYAKNTFVVRCGVYPAVTNSTTATFSYPNPSVSHWIRKIILKLEVATRSGKYHSTHIDSSDWRYLLRSDLADCQDYFQLDEMQLVLRLFNPECTWPCLDAENRRTLLKKKFGGLKAKKTTVPVRVRVWGLCGACTSAMVEVVQELFA